jgi:Fe2+ transport system protein FeoA
MFTQCQKCVLANKTPDNIRRLGDFDVGDEVNVLSVAGNDDLRIKIMEMGVVSGARIKITKKAPFGDPLIILIRGYDLTIRKTEADLIIVNKIN